MATLIVTKLDDMPSYTMKIMTSIYPSVNLSRISTIKIKSSDPKRAIENIVTNTHLRLRILPLTDLIRDVDIFESSMPPRRQPTK